MKGKYKYLKINKMFSKTQEKFNPTSEKSEERLSSECFLEK